MWLGGATAAGTGGVTPWVGFVSPSEELLESNDAAGGAFTVVESAAASEPAAGLETLVLLPDGGGGGGSPSLGFALLTAAPPPLASSSAVRFRGVTRGARLTGARYSDISAKHSDISSGGSPMVGTRVCSQSSPSRHNPLSTGLVSTAPRHVNPIKDKKNIAQKALKSRCSFGSAIREMKDVAGLNLDC
jgi:hypothetical protein